jgi:hypothetical protein
MGAKEMPEIRINVNNRIAKAEKDAVMVCRNSDYAVVFNFDEEWSGFGAKTALFTYNGKTIYVPFSGSVCKAPELIKTVEVLIGVTTGDLTNGDTPEIQTTTSAYVPCFLSAKDETDEYVEPPKPEVYDEIIALINSGMLKGEKGDMPDISHIENALMQSGMTELLETEEAYDTRTTAGGARVVDGSKSVLKKVVGNTVVGKNLCKPFSKRSAVTSLTQFGDGDGYWFAANRAGGVNLIQPDRNLGSGNSYYIDGDICAFQYKAGQQGIGFDVPCTVGKSYVLSFENLTPEYNTAIAFSYFNANNEVLSGNVTNSTSVTVTPPEGCKYILFIIAPTGNSVSTDTDFKAVKITNIQVEEGTKATAYEAYKEPINAVFGGIKSTNQKGEESVLGFPETELPSGTEIDFDRRVIVNADGTETPFTDEMKEAGNEYTVWQGGTETVLDNDGASSGVLPTLTQSYTVVNEMGQGGGGEVDLKDYQKKEDGALETESKTIVGAINEVNAKAGQGGSGSGGNVNLTDYQKKQDSTLNTSSKLVVGAINEVNTKVNNIPSWAKQSAKPSYSYTEISGRLQIGTSSGTAYDGAKGNKNASDISSLTTRMATAETNIGNKQNKLQFDGTYNESSNKVATVSTVTNKVSSEIAKVVANAPSSYDTLKEIAEWIGNNPDGASAMNTAINANKQSIESLKSSKQDKLTAGDNITISAGGVISATGGGVEGGLGEQAVRTIAQEEANGAVTTANDYTDGKISELNAIIGDLNSDLEEILGE